MVTASPIWPIDDKGSWIFDFSIFQIHLFTMELFFMISGFFFALQLSKKTSSEVLKDRLQKILSPFVLAMVLIVPFILSFFEIEKYNSNQWYYLDIIKKCYIKGLNLGFKNFFPTAHLWYLYYLILFYVLTFIFKNIFIKLTLFLYKFSFFLLILITIIISIISMFFMKRWFVDNPLTLVPEIPSFIHFFLFYILGILLFSIEKYQFVLKKNGKLLLLIGIILGVISTLPQFYFEKTETQNYSLIKFIAIFLYILSSYLITLGLIGFAAKKLNKTSKPIEYLSDATYWIYISNVPIVMFFHLILKPLQISIFIKFTIAFVISYIISILTYDFFIRYTWLSKYFGKSRRRNNSKYQN